MEKKIKNDINDLANLSAELLNDLSLFTKVFFRLRTGRDFKISKPISRESHHNIIFRALNRVVNGDCKNLLVNVAPRHGKSEILIHFCAWAFARNPSSNFLYVSVSQELAVKASVTVREIISSPYYSKLFGVTLKEGSEAKDDFQTSVGGRFSALGANSTIVGKGAGCFGVNEFAGAIIVDDLQKPQEITSKIQRENSINWWSTTLLSRRNNGNRTPIICLAQRIHAEDISSYLLTQENWEYVVIKSLDDAGNALHPDLYNKEDLIRMRDTQPYAFYSQHQQNPQPDGGTIFKEEYFNILDEDPEIISTFITVDTAESIKDYADYTVFSFFGLYKVIQNYVQTDLYALHWIDCLEMRIEPKDLQSEFLAFYAKCMRYKVRPKFSAIEKKSTGATLTSVLSGFQGMNILPIERTKSSGNKTTRFLEMQPYVASKLVTFTQGTNHLKNTIKHMCAITTNNTHAHDDIADTLYDAIKLALIDKTFINIIVSTPVTNNLVRNILREQESFNQNRLNRW